MSRLVYQEGSEKMDVLQFADENNVYGFMRENAAKKIGSIEKIMPNITTYLEPLVEYWEKSKPPLGHGYGHALNTAYHALEIIERSKLPHASGYVPAIEVLLLAGFYHDILRPVEVHENNGIVPNGVKSAELTSSLLEGLCRQEELYIISKLIKYHDDPTVLTNDDLIFGVMCLRLADMQDVYPARVLACVHDFNSKNRHKLKDDVILNKWKKKHALDSKVMSIMKKYGLSVEQTEARYKRVADFLEDSIKNGILDTLIGRCASIERTWHQAVYDELRERTNV
jgi:hypothetical protein